MADIEWTVEPQEEPVEFEVIEAKLKPELVAHVMPEYEPQTVLPPLGSVFGSVEVDAITDPTDTLNITENGTYDVARIGTAVVNVPQGVFPEGTLPVTVNGEYDVTEYVGVDVDVPVEWVSPSGKMQQVVKRVTLPDDFSGQATAFIPLVTSLAGIDVKHQSVVVTSISLVASGSQSPATNELKDLVIGYTAGLRFKRNYYNGMAWTVAIATNTYFNIVASAGSEYEVVGFEM